MICYANAIIKPPFSFVVIILILYTTLYYTTLYCVHSPLLV